MTDMTDQMLTLNKTILDDFQNYNTSLEHEACAQEIAELRWDLDNWLEEKKEMEKQVLAAVERNRLLQNSIEELTAQWLVISRAS